MHINSYLKEKFQYNVIAFEGVSIVKIYLLRLVFFLTFVFVGKDAWTAILFHEGSWQPLEAVAFSVWAAYATLSFLGLFHTLKMLPLILFQIFYKTIWLVAVAYPLWVSNQLVGSSAEGITYSFLWVLLPVVAMPWGYLFKNYFVVRRNRGVESV